MRMVQSLLRARLDNKGWEFQALALIPLVPIALAAFFIVLHGWPVPWLHLGLVILLMTVGFFLAWALASVFRNVLLHSTVLFLSYQVLVFVYASGTTTREISVSDFLFGRFGSELSPMGTGLIVIAVYLATRKMSGSFSSADRTSESVS